MRSYLRDDSVNLSPEIIIVYVDGLTDTLYQLEKDIGLLMDDSVILTTLIDCMSNEVNARLELEYCYMNLISKQINRQNYDERDFEIFMSFLDKLSVILLQNLRNIGVYTDGLFSYAYCNRRNDSVRFMKRTSLLNLIKRELADDGLYTSPRSPLAQHKRFI